MIYFNLFLIALLPHLIWSSNLRERIERVVSVSMYDGDFISHEGIVQNWVAKANFTDNTFVDGWSYLEVESSNLVPDIIQSYAAGYVEGVSSSSIIYNSWKNTQEGFCNWKGEQYCKELREFLSKNMDWMRSQIRTQRHTSPVWHHVEIVLSQLKGLSDGYNLHSKNPISEEDFFLMNTSGDLEDLENVLNSQKKNMTFVQWLNSPQLFSDGRCSALIKVLPNFEDIYVSHVTWNSYQSMLRVQKKFILPFTFTDVSNSNNVVPGHIASFSSYPAYLHSGDDFYVLSSGLATQETTTGNSNPELWKNVKPEGELLEWIRVIVANRLSTSGKEWCSIFKQFNSGTYNNQWMVIDYKLFKPGKSLSPETLYILEQLPGMIKYADKTDVLLNQMYWPSYNTLYFKDMFAMSGGPALVAKYGDWFSYELTPRARIFARDHTKVTDLPSMLKLMRYNDFKKDPFAACDCVPPYSAENGISSRSDLNPANGTYPFGALEHRSHGGTDVKITSAALMLKFRFQSIAGPTFDQQPIFKWSEQDFEKTTPHHGMPDSFAFKYVEHKWVW